MADEVPPVVKADEAPPYEIPFYQSPQAIAAIAAIGGGAAAFCAAFHIVIPFSAIEISAGLGGLMAILGGSFALYRRVRAGLSPTNTASKLTLF